VTSSPGAVVVVGSLNTDHVVRVAHLPGEGETVTGSHYLLAAGGKGLNQAVAAARQGASVVFVGCVGADGPGRELLRLLVDEGVDVSHVRVVDEVATGVALVTVAEDGANSIVVAPLANGRLTPCDIEAAGTVIERAGVLLAQLEVPASAVEAALTRARGAGVVTILNPAPASGPLPAGLLASVDILVPNASEAAAITGVAVDDAVVALRRLGPSTVVVTVGEEGSLVASEDGVARVAPFPVRATDTTGAGDAFCGVLAAAIAAGSSLPVALRRASAAGALTATIHGAVPSLPTAAAVEGLLAGPHTDARSSEAGRWSSTT
jgi:ribokinase